MYTSISKEVTIMGKKKKKKTNKERKKTNDVLCKGREVGGNIENVGNNPC